MAALIITRYYPLAEKGIQIVFSKKRWVLEQQEYLEKIKKTGFEDVQVVSSREFYVISKIRGVLERLLSITVKAYKQNNN